ncbi:MAG TPA: hypothetical protein VFY14_09660, partial [Streptomyces sp.]|nr:hypothetical protein [Streptomyces sp.]
PSMRPVKLVGFLGVLLAYAVRSLVEAPGEKRLRAEYDRAVERHERRAARNARTRGDRGTAPTGRGGAARPKARPRGRRRR